MSKKTPKSFADVMAADTNGRRRVTDQVCFSPDIAEEYQALIIAAADAQAREGRRDPEKRQAGGRRLTDGLESSNRLKAAATLIEDNPTAFYDVVLEQSPRADWLRLLAAHAPRDGHAEDGRFNSETFPTAALSLAMIDPEPTAETIAYFEEVLTTGEWRRLTLVIWNLNEGTRQLPKADRVSSILGQSETT